MADSAQIDQGLDLFCFAIFLGFLKTDFFNFAMLGVNFAVYT